MEYLSGATKLYTRRIFSMLGPTSERGLRSINKYPQHNTSQFPN